MRKIKFRVWDKINKSMHPKHGVLSEIRWDQKNELSFIEIYEYIQINEEGDGDWDGFSKDKGEFELMQFTGLLDRNNKEIYEGDIVKAYSYYDEAESELNDFTIHAVIWGDEYPAFDLEPLIYCECNALQLFANVQPNNEEIEIIGNIYENPELLKKGIK